MRVLCVCKGNTCRSPMFAAVLRQKLAETGRSDVTIESAGYMEAAKGQPANPEWIGLREETPGVDLSGHVSRWTGDLDLREFDLIVCMEPNAVDEVRKQGVPETTSVVLANEAEGGIPNPYQQGPDAYRNCYRAIVSVVGEFVLPS